MGTQLAKMIIERQRQQRSRPSRATSCRPSSGISHAPAMFVVTEADAAAIRAVYQQHGEFAAAVELRRRFPGITDNTQARDCARTIAGWKPAAAANGEAVAQTAAVTPGPLTRVGCRTWPSPGRLLIARRIGGKEG